MVPVRLLGFNVTYRKNTTIVVMKVLSENKVAEAKNSPFAQCKKTQPSQTIVHAQLEMTKPGDADENEANAMADAIVSGGKIRRQISGGTAGSGIAVSTAMESQLAQAQGGGRTMPDGLRNMMEAGFGRDFSNVRIHTDSQAAEMSSNLSAKAFTLGNDIYFNKGQFSPSTTSGQHLIAHELTHVVQGSGKVGREPTSVDTPDTSLCDLGERGTECRDSITLSFYADKMITDRSYMQQAFSKYFEVIKSNADRYLIAAEDVYKFYEEYKNQPQISVANGKEILLMILGIKGINDPRIALASYVVTAAINIYSNSASNSNSIHNIKKLDVQREKIISLYKEHFDRVNSYNNPTITDDDMKNVAAIFKNTRSIGIEEFKSVISQCITEEALKTILSNTSGTDVRKTYYDSENQRMEYLGWDTNDIDAINYLISNYGKNSAILSYNKTARKRLRDLAYYANVKFNETSKRYEAYSLQRGVMVLFPDANSSNIAETLNNIIELEGIEEDDKLFNQKKAQFRKGPSIGQGY